MRWNLFCPRWATQYTIFSLFITYSTSSLAINEWKEMYNNARSLAMGGASVAITSDETSLYRNPANLGSIRGGYGVFLDPEIEGSSNFVEQVTSSFTGKAFNIPDVITVLDSHRDDYYHARAQLTPALIMRNIGVGLFYRNEFSARMNTAGTEMDTYYQNDVGAILGINFRLFDGRIKIGGNAKAISRIEVVNPTLSTTGPTDIGTIGSEGLGYSFDGGLLIQIPWTYIPTIGAVVKDIGGTKFDKHDGFRRDAPTRPQQVLQSVDVGVSLFPIHNNNLRSVWTLEYTDVTNSRNDTDKAKKIHAGIELNSRDIFFFRVGYNQRYWTAGLEIASEKFQWQVTSYGEEIGTYAAPEEDRRLVTKISLRF